MKTKLIHLSISLLLTLRAAAAVLPPDALVAGKTQGEWSAEWWDGFEVSADGERFIIFENIPNPEAVPPAIIVTQNWFAEFSASR